MWYAQRMFEVVILVVTILTVSLPMPTMARVLITIIGFGLVIPGLIAALKGPPYVPTTGKTFKKMLEWGEIKKGQKVYDIGCGDGRFVFAAADKGAKAVGYELSLPVYILAKIRSWSHPGSSIEMKNFWKQDYKDADVIFCFLLMGVMDEFEKVIWPQLKPGTRVISHAFRMHGLKPAKQEQQALLYIK